MPEQRMKAVEKELDNEKRAHLLLNNKTPDKVYRAFYV